MNSKKTLCIITCSKQKIWDKNKNNILEKAKNKEDSANSTEQKICDDDKYRKDISKKAKAKDAYMGKITRLGIKFAEKFFDGNYVIISAKFGFLKPDDEIYNYNLYLGKLNKEDRKKLIDCLKKQIKEKNLDAYDKIIVIAGKDYLEIVKEVFKDKKIYTIKGWQNKKYGEKLKLLNEILKRDSITFDFFEEV